MDIFIDRPARELSMKTIIVMGLLACAAGLWACDNRDSDAHHDEHGHAHQDNSEHGHAHGEESEHGHDEEREHEHQGEQDHHEGSEDGGHQNLEPNYAADGTVEVPNDGKTFKPPVSIDRLPPGAWYCDMGKAPWASMQKPPDGCPLVDAPLKQTSK